MSIDKLFENYRVDIKFDQESALHWGHKLILTQDGTIRLSTDIILDYHLYVKTSIKYDGRYIYCKRGINGSK